MNLHRLTPATQEPGMTGGDEKDVLSMHTLGGARQHLMLPLFAACRALCVAV